MRGLGDFQRAQMKHRDARVSLMCDYLRSAIDVFEQIASEPFQKPEKPSPPASPPIAPTVGELPSDKVAYTLREAASALGIGRTTIYRAIADGELSAVKLGARTLIPADALRAWLQSLPQVQARRSRRR